MGQINRFAALSGLIAALSMATTPAAAADMPGAPHSANSAIPMHGVFDADTLKAQRHRYWRHRDRIDAGDVLAGVLIIGGIAAIANAASKSERDRNYRDERYRDYRNDRQDYRDRRDTRRSTGGRGIDGAVDMCVAEIERDVRIDSVDSVDRSGDGWRVTGTIFNGDRFTCQIGADGRIDTVDYGGGFAAAEPAQGNQHSDDRYRAAWANVDRGAQPASGERAEQLPAYPGGPIDGDLQDGADDRYDIADSPGN
ncbi:hypothetical protein [Altererythrobacter sp. Z27]|uniref:hypothetical protein n=1 Tax=Altererythrobacter sp. Z27 TaxID=3461147 RepID=UPI0040444702